MTVESLRELVARLSVSASALAVLGIAVEQRAKGIRLDPAINSEVGRVLAALGATERLENATAAELNALASAIRVALFQGSKLLLTQAGAPGWTHTEPAILESLGEVSTAVPALLKQTIVPHLEGLTKRLDSADAAFLDVGVGVGALAISMARLWPSLRVVGIDVWKPALALAQEKVKAAELDSRIELREQAIQDLSDAAAYDLVWLPAFFISNKIIGASLLSIHRALRPGGWIVLGLQNAGADDLTAALARFRTVHWGGDPRTPAEAEALLTNAGFDNVKAIPSTVVAAVVGRRA
jgi:SAM-dependent methyltransferase